MRGLVIGTAVAWLAAVVVAAALGAQTVDTARSQRTRALELATGWRLVLGTSAARSLVFPCKRAGRYCAAAPLAANKAIFTGELGVWRDFEVCHQLAPGEPERC